MVACDNTNCEREWVRVMSFISRTSPTTINSFIMAVLGCWSHQRENGFVRTAGYDRKIYEDKGGII